VARGNISCKQRADGSGHGNGFAISWDLAVFPIATGKITAGFGTAISVQIATTRPSPFASCILPPGKAISLYAGFAAERHEKHTREATARSQLANRRRVEGFRQIGID